MADESGITSAASSDWLKAAAGPIGSAIDAVSGFIGNLFSANQAKKNRQFQERMYNQSVEDARENWRMVNEYNLPSAQVQRMLDANMNPYLLNEGGTSMATAAPETPSPPHGGQATNSMRTNFGQSLQQAALTNAQIENLEADSAQKLANAGESTSRTNLNNFELSFKQDTKDLDIGLKASQYDLNKALENESREKRYLIYNESEKCLAEINSIVQATENAKNLTEAQINDINERLAGFNKQLPYIIANLESQTRKNYADAFVAQVTGNYMKNLYSDDYIKILQGTAGQQYLNAIKYGTAQDIENGLRALEFAMKPKPGESPWEYNRFLNNILAPSAELLKDAVMIGGSFYVGSKVAFGGKPARIGFK